MIPSRANRAWAVPLLSVTALLAQACGSSEFGNSGTPLEREKPKSPSHPKGKPAAKKDGAGSGDVNAGKTTPATPVTGDANAGKTTPATPVTGDLCAGRTGSLRVFILDLKSGWFAGDGGDTFKDFIADSCGAKVDIVYAHVTRKVIEGNIAEKPDAKRLLQCDLNDLASFRFVPGLGVIPNVEGQCRLGDLSSFQQVWILGGSESDEDDIPVNSPFFASIAKRVGERAARADPAAFFIGAGLGNTMHANALAPSISQVLAGAFVAAPSRGELGILPEPERLRSEFSQKPLEAGDGITPGTFLGTHPLFAGLKVLADYAPRPNETCTGDGIATLASVRPIAVDICGQVSVAESATKVGGRVLLEANMARFYVTKPSEWFNRIVNWLQR